MHASVQTGPAWHCPLTLIGWRAAAQAHGHTAVIAAENHALAALNPATHGHRECHLLEG